MQQKASTKENINSLIEFRQAIYEQGMLARRDALFDLLDTLIVEGQHEIFNFLVFQSQLKRNKIWEALDILNSISPDDLFFGHIKNTSQLHYVVGQKILESLLTIIQTKKLKLIQAFL